MPDVIWIIVTVQTVPGLKYLCTWPHTGTAATAASPPINSTFLSIFIVVLAFCVETSGRPAGGGVSLRPAVFRERRSYCGIWMSEAPPTAGTGRQRMREDTTCAARAYRTDDGCRRREHHRRPRERRRHADLR